MCFTSQTSAHVIWELRTPNTDCYSVSYVSTSTKRADQTNDFKKYVVDGSGITAKGWRQNCSDPVSVQIKQSVYHSSV
jgi:hypothetical protein